ncbi:conserved Plasmodium protein, unknown function [Plasmodium malariae]|uniref:Uncharacterized protein n=1 Tax=Plasmodium malariae TaxID=5858 RepID=A0A1A8VQH3_PLAMA|nr:conserved Plasmodium protein, unknown function [Plasmodium malariae]SBS81927.1 hypothetical protein, conserved [Plasmodium malariae]SBT86230.1 conserved Plasmodium protein, unknown function [Plasmodium malariae]
MSTNKLKSSTLLKIESKNVEREKKKINNNSISNNNKSSSSNNKSSSSNNKSSSSSNNNNNNNSISNNNNNNSISNNNNNNSNSNSSSNNDNSSNNNKIDNNNNNGSNNSLRKHVSLKIVRKKIDNAHADKNVVVAQGTLREENAKIIKNKILKKVQDASDVVDCLSSSKISNDENKKTVFKKGVHKLNTRKDETNDTDDEDDNENGINNNDNADGNTNSNSKTTTTKKIIRIKKPKEQVINKHSPLNNFNELNAANAEHVGEQYYNSNEKSVKMEDSENEILNSIIEKKSFLITDQPNDVKKKKKKIIVKKVPITEKSKVGGKMEENAGYKADDKQDDKCAYSILYKTSSPSSRISNIGRKNTSSSAGKNFEKANNEIGMNKAKLDELMKTHESEISNIKKEKKIQEEKLSIYIQNLNDEMYNLNNKLNDELKEKYKMEEMNEYLKTAKSGLEEKVNTLQKKIDESNELYSLLNEKFVTLEEENKLLLERDEENNLKVQNLEEEKTKLEKKLEEKNILIKKKDETINKYNNEIENYKNVLKSKGEMILLNNSSSTIVDKNSAERNSQKEYINKLTKEKKELTYAFKKQLDLIVILKKQINLLENNKILNITSNEFKKILQD